MEDLVARSAALRSLLCARRSVRAFDPARPVPREVVEDCIAIAASAPSGANTQPWTFVLVGDPIVKRAVRAEAESVEREFYERRASEEWKDRLAPLGTNASKPFLEEAQYLVCVFVQRHGMDERGAKVTHYWPTESTSIAVGLLVSAVHQLGLGCLTYTPQPMGFLSAVLGRPDNERPLVIVAVGYPAPGYVPPALRRKEPGEYLRVV